jgi:hypothetical protein
MNGASELPPVQTTATGSALFTLVGSEMFYTVSFAGLTGPATGGHIHGPADSTTNATVIIPFDPPATNSGTFSGSVSLNPTNLAYLLSGQTYINIHTATNGGGEIRGQIYPIQFSALLRRRFRGSPPRLRQRPRSAHLLSSIAHSITISSLRTSCRLPPVRTSMDLPISAPTRM